MIFKIIAEKDGREHELGAAFSKGIAYKFASSVESLYDKVRVDELLPQKAKLVYCFC